MEKTEVKAVAPPVQKIITLSKEYRRGDLHRHHHFDFHSVVMHHQEPYHSHLVRTVYDNKTLKFNRTKIGKLAFAAFSVIGEINHYEITPGPILGANITYTVTNAESDHTYNVVIRKDQTYHCNCPGFLSYNKLGLPCKHVILVACAKGHEIKL